MTESQPVRQKVLSLGAGWLVVRNFLSNNRLRGFVGPNWIFHIRAIRMASSLHLGFCGTGVGSLNPDTFPVQF